jgi:hypothetical protein
MSPQETLRDIGRVLAAFLALAFIAQLLLGA